MVLHGPIATNILNIYTFSVATQALDITISRRKLNLFVGVFSLAAVVFFIFQEDFAAVLDAWLIGLVAWVAAWGGVMLVHYFWIEQRWPSDAARLFDAVGTKRLPGVNSAASPPCSSASSSPGCSCTGWCRPCRASPPCPRRPGPVLARRRPVGCGHLRAHRGPGAPPVRRGVRQRRGVTVPGRSVALGARTRHARPRGRAVTAAVTAPGAGEPIFTWPDGVRAAAAFTFDVDAESCVLAHDPAAATRMSLMSHQSYGPRVGVPKILRILARQDIRATFFVPGFTAECHPDVVRAIVDGGHEIGHHGYLHEQMQGIDRETEARYLDRGLEALQRVAGVVPVGYRAPWWELNWQTPGLLAQRGFRYDSSLLDGDAPYRFAVAPGSADSLVEVPVDWALDDWEQYAFYPGWTGSGVIESPAKAREMWQLEADAQHAQGGCWVLTNHPFISGRPSRAHALEQLIEGVKALDGMWVTTLEEIARHAADVTTEVRTHTRYEVPSFPDAPILRDGVPVRG